MPKQKFEREPEGRHFRDDEYKRPEEDKLHPDPESPFETEIISPSMVKINELKPSFDILVPEYASVIVPAYLKFVGGGPREIKSSLTTDRSGVVTFEYGYRDPKTGKTTQDFWDYQGPMKVSFKASFVGGQLGSKLRGHEEVVKKFFLAGGYDDTAEGMGQHEEVLSSLRPEVTYELTNFAVNSFLIPTSQKKAYKLEDADFVRKILDSKPALFVHWRTP